MGIGIIRHSLNDDKIALVFHLRMARSRQKADKSLFLLSRNPVQMKPNIWNDSNPRSIYH